MQGWHFSKHAENIFKKSRQKNCLWGSLRNSQKIPLMLFGKGRIPLGRFDILNGICLYFSLVFVCILIGICLYFEWYLQNRQKIPLMLYWKRPDTSWQIRYPVLDRNSPGRLTNMVGASWLGWTTSQDQVWKISRNCNFDFNAVPVYSLISAGEYPQDCPPQDWLPGGQSWGGQSWPPSVIRIAHLNYNTI